MTSTKKNGLTSEGIHILQMLMTKYGMQEDKALELIKDGGTPLALALLVIAR